MTPYNEHDLPTGISNQFWVWLESGSARNEFRRDRNLRTVSSTSPGAKSRWRAPTILFRSFSSDASAWIQLVPRSRKVSGPITAVRVGKNPCFLAYINSHTHQALLYRSFLEFRTTQKTVAAPTARIAQWQSTKTTVLHCYTHETKDIVYQCLVGKNRWDCWKCRFHKK